MLTTLSATQVEKENISSLRFPSAEVLDNPQQRKERARKLGRATFLGNIEHNKIRIYFEDDEGMKMVHTTIWATGSDHIVLKRGVTVPIRRIHDVQLL